MQTHTEEENETARRAKTESSKKSIDKTKTTELEITAQKSSEASEETHLRQNVPAILLHNSNCNDNFKRYTNSIPV